MYHVIYRSDTFPYNYSKLGSFATVSDAAAARQVAGDLVVDQSMNPVQGEEWLFEWEKKDEYCYARRMQKVAQDGNWKLGRNHGMLKTA